tara:strand:- start:322 stop:537 length:216 start_codon:yes stop_codon:yes gene_type:complete
MARAALGWSVRQLAAKAGVSANTVSRYENGADALGETLKKMRKALENAGLDFIEGDDSAGPGVRMRRIKEQ